MTSVPGFLTKTFEIFSTPEFADCCGWGQNGDTIIIRKIEQFSKQVLPRYFKHSNFQSFVRQLNMYDFHKTVQDPNHGEFQHQYFRQNKPELLIHIKRKANNRAAETIKKLSSSSNSGKTTLPATNSTINNGHSGHMSSSLGNGSSAVSSMNTYNPVAKSNSLPKPTSLVPSTTALTLANSTALVPMKSVLGIPDMEEVNRIIPEELALEVGAVLSELEQQKAMRADFEQRMEARLSELEGENHQLKSLFMETHQKNQQMQERLEKVLKTMCNVFLSNSTGNGLNRALTGKMMNMLLPDIQGNYVDCPPAGYSGVRALLDAPSVIEAVPEGEVLDRLPSIDFSNDPLIGSVTGTIANGNNTISGGYPSDPYGVSSYLLDNNRYAGGELQSINSFDYAAASVIPPGNLKSFKSFDASYFTDSTVIDGTSSSNDNMHESNSSIDMSNREYYSDRVTVLPDDSNSGSLIADPISLSASSSRKYTSSSTSKHVDNNINIAGRRVMSGNGTSTISLPPPLPTASGLGAGSVGLVDNTVEELFSFGNDITSPPTAASLPSALATSSGSSSINQHKRKATVGFVTDDADKRARHESAIDGHTNANTINTTVPFSSDTSSLGVVDPVLTIPHVPENDTMHFINLLNRNQNTTLNRLDSLEMTLASLLDNAEGETTQVTPIIEAKVL